MKLIFDFNSSQNGNKELKEILGFLDADFELSEMKSEVEAATIELRKIIGKQTYKAIADWYEEETPTNNQTILIAKAQSAIANGAYMQFAPKSDLAATNQGRQMRMDEHHKAPFEWMISRHNEQLERSYYRAIDYLIEELDEINPEVDNSNNQSVKWKDTDAYKNSFDVLFRTTDEFNEFFTIDSRYLLMKLAPGIKKAQTDEIIPRMTPEKFNQYITALKANAPVPDEKTLSIIKAACAYTALSWAIRRMSATLFPEGVFQIYQAGLVREGTIKAAPLQGEVGVLSELFKDDAKAALAELEELIKPKPNPSDEPLWDFNIKPTDNFVTT